MICFEKEHFLAVSEKQLIVLPLVHLNKVVMNSYA